MVDTLRDIYLLCTLLLQWSSWLAESRAGVLRWRGLRHSKVTENYELTDMNLNFLPMTKGTRKQNETQLELTNQYFAQTI